MYMRIHSIHFNNFWMNENDNDTNKHMYVICICIYKQTCVMRVGNKVLGGGFGAAVKGLYIEYIDTDTYTYTHF